MLLRSQLISRFPPAVLRLYCNSAPSTSYLSSVELCPIATSIPQVARHFGAIVLAAPWAQNVGARKALKRPEEAKEEQTQRKTRKIVAEEVKQPSIGERLKRSYDRYDRDRRSNRNNRGGDEDPVTKRAKLIVFMCLLSMAWVPAEWAFDKVLQSLGNGVIPADAQQVDYDAFVQKYLTTGKIQKITLVVANEKAVITLRAGAVIDGKPAESDHIVVDYAKTKFKSDFESDLRAVESKMRIPPSAGVPIVEFNPHWQWRLAVKLSGYAVAGLCVVLQLNKQGRRAMVMLADQMKRKFTEFVR